MFTRFRRFRPGPAGWFGRKAVRADQASLEEPTDSVRLDPAAIFAPAPAAIETYSRFDATDGANIEQLNEDRLLYRGLLYSRYLGGWHFHPGRIGGELSRIKRPARLIEIAKAVQDKFVELPNGGLALYYPKTFQLARLQTSEYLYSAIAQGQLLGGYTRLVRDKIPAPDGIDWSVNAERIAASMRFPFEEGGVCVDGKVLLELPNYRSCPEIVLNGWIDALLHLHDYLEIVPNASLREFLDRNIAALAELLPLFDDEPARLSRYSNLCPYVFRVRLKGPMRASLPQVNVEYVSTRSGYRSYHIANLPVLEAGKSSPYDNGITAYGSKWMEVSVSATRLYDIRLRVGADCIDLVVDPGTVDEKSTLPSRSRRRRTLLPEASMDGCTTFLARADDLDLVPGCPTNFVRRGRNFYHIYHIVGLRELAFVTRNGSDSARLIAYSDRWLDYTRDPVHAQSKFKREFDGADEILESISRNRTGKKFRSFEELRKATPPASIG